MNDPAGPCFGTHFWHLKNTVLYQSLVQVLHIIRLLRNPVFPTGLSSNYELVPVF